MTTDHIMRFETKPGQSSRTARPLRTSAPRLAVPTSYPVGEIGALSSQREGKTMTQLRTHRAAASPARRQAGLTLVELMVALTIGLIMIGAIGTLFIGSSGARREVQSSADAFENARYAMDLLNRELSQAGFYGTWSDPLDEPSPGGWDPCSTSVDTWKDTMAYHVFGWNQGDTDLNCLTDQKEHTDAIFIQRASTCEAGVGGCATRDNDLAYIHVRECVEPASNDHRVLRGNATGADAFTLKAKTCGASIAPSRQFIRRIYYIRQNGDQKDVLSYLEIRPGGNVTVQLVENIEQLQLAYAVDTSGDGSPDRFEPATAVTTAEEWGDVVGVRVWLVARSETESDRRPSGLTQSFELDDMAADGLDLTKAYRRSVSSSYISFVSPTLRKAK
jgi:type IV pilus assembly protein PilW